MIILLYVAVQLKKKKKKVPADVVSGVGNHGNWEFELKPDLRDWKSRG